MAVGIFNNKQKVLMYLQRTSESCTVTKIAEKYGTSERTVSRSIKEVKDYLASLYVGQKVMYLGLLGEIIEIESEVNDQMPVVIKDGHSAIGFVALYRLMDENPLIAVVAKPVIEEEPTSKFVVGSRVTLRSDSEFSGHNEDSNPSGISGTVSSTRNDFNLNIRVDWDNGTVNSYADKDLDMVADYSEDLDADYFVVAPQDSVSIVRVDKNTGEVETRNTNKHNTSFADIRKMVVASQNKETLQKAFILMDIRGIIEAFSVGRVKVDPEGETVVFVKADGTERRVPEDVAGDIINTIKEDGRENGEKLVRFLDKLMDNVSFKAIQGLYSFMKDQSITINDDGSIQAWKGVRSDMYSAKGGDIKSSETIKVDSTGHVYNGDFGIEIRVDRSEVDDDPKSSCSHGLHVGSRAYATAWSEKLLLVRVEPQDVVAVPDNEDGKMRTCGYTPVRVVEK
jgi:preprotein translocase subunit YajC